MIATISWFIHSSADWLWQLAAVSLPAMMLLGGLVGATEARSLRAPCRPARLALRPSALVRALAVLISIVALASAVFPYLSLRYSEVAAGASDLDRMTARAQTLPSSTYLGAALRHPCLWPSGRRSRGTGPID